MPAPIQRLSGCPRGTSTPCLTYRPLGCDEEPPALCHCCAWLRHYFQMHRITGTGLTEGPMTVSSPISNGTTVRHRQTKFTHENIRLITDLVERGKSRKEIAEVIGVTPGTLAATCSRLKVSLRRPSASSEARRRAQRPRSLADRRPAGP